MHYSPYSTPARLERKMKMPVYKDKETGKWYVKCYYTDWKGEKHQRKKRGFEKQSEAKEWERNFLETQQADLSMLFENFIQVYNEDIRHRIREHTFIQKQYIINKKLLPFFGKLPVSQITPAHVRKWQNELLSYHDAEGRPYSETYLKTINNQLTAILNYAVRYYNLKENPCKKAGSIGKSHADEMNFWTVEEFKTFLSIIEDKPQSKAGFMILYYTGLRIGELLALEVCDIDLANKTINVNKSYQRINNRDVITPPKTPKSTRIVTIPDFLADELRTYMQQLYKPHKHDRIFPYTKYFFEHEMIRGTKSGAVKKIRLHDLRHSHASLLIELGCTPLAIADRLGHEKVETTLNTYSHLFPNKRQEVAESLQKYF